MKIDINIIIAIISAVGIIVTAVTTHINTNRQIKNINKENNRPIVVIKSMKLIATGKKSKAVDLYFDKYIRLQKKQEEFAKRKHIEDPSTIKITLTNLGGGLAKNIIIIDDNKDVFVNYSLNDSENEWIKKKKIYSLPVGESSNIEVIPQYIREEKLVEDEEPFSDCCSLKLIYSDIGNNYYSSNLKMYVVYDEESKKFIVEYKTEEAIEYRKKDLKHIDKNSEVYLQLKRILKR